MSEKGSFGEAMVKVKRRLKGPAVAFLRNGDLSRVLSKIREVEAEVGEVPSLGAISYALVFTDWLGAVRAQYTENQRLQQIVEKRWQDIIDSANERGVKPPENYSGLRLKAMSCLWQMLEEASDND